MITQIAQHLNILESAIAQVEEWANVLFVRFIKGSPRFVSKKVKEKETMVETTIEVDGVVAKYNEKQWKGFDTPGYWYLFQKGINGATVMKTRDEAEERCKNEAKVSQAKSLVKSQCITRSEYEKLCKQYNVEQHSDGEIKKGSYGLKYGDFHLPEYSVEQIIENNFAYSRLKAIEQEKSTPCKPSTDQLAGAMGMIKNSRGEWIDEDEWLEAQESGIDL